MLAVYALAAAAYVLLPGGMAANASLMGMPMPDVPLWQLAAANVLLIVVVYGVMAFAGDALARRSGLPGALPAEVSPRALWLEPLAIGAGAGVGLVAIDRVTALVAPRFGGFPHPAFPSSVLASLTAGIGEEIAFRLFVLSLWAWLLTGLARWLGRPALRPAALGAANALAALAFAAGHLGSATLLAGVTTPLALPPAELVELLVLNGALGLLAGRAFLRHGLLAASGVHFWADVVWHVLFPVLLGGA
ncbi:MAG: CPBP family glutamic-type intramembrane protease [Deinococcales bacterium]